MYVFIYLVKLGNRVAPYREIAAHSAYSMFPKFFPTSAFGVGILFVIASFPDHCLLLTLYLAKDTVSFLIISLPILCTSQSCLNEFIIKYNILCNKRLQPIKFREH